jgi:hypothetical protein
MLDVLPMNTAALLLVGFVISRKITDADWAKISVVVVDEVTVTWAVTKLALVVGLAITDPVTVDDPVVETVPPMVTVVGTYGCVPGT